MRGLSVRSDWDTRYGPRSARRRPAPSVGYEADFQYIKLNLNIREYW